MTSEPWAAATVTRTFAAPPERVFDAWLNPGLIGRWIFGGGALARAEIDPRVGGAFSLVAHGDGPGEEIVHAGRYLEIDRPRRLAFTWAIPADSPAVDRVVVDIVPQGTGCKLTLTHELHPDWVEYADRTAAAWTRMLAALEPALDAAVEEASARPR